MNIHSKDVRLQKIYSKSRGKRGCVPFGPEIPTLPFRPKTSFHHFIISGLSFSLNILPFCFLFFVFFCNFPLAMEDNDFPASLVFLARSFIVFLWYLGLVLPLWHPTMSLRFFGHGNALDCLDFVQGLHSFWFWLWSQNAGNGISDSHILKIFPGGTCPWTCPFWGLLYAAPKTSLFFLVDRVRISVGLHPQHKCTRLTTKGSLPNDHPVNITALFEVIENPVISLSCNPIINLF